MITNPAFSWHPANIFYNAEVSEAELVTSQAAGVPAILITTLVIVVIFIIYKRG